ncbi:MAG: transporter [Rhodocyclaceae bacterium]|nr:MAG: transporter [Rhodocyclaceae bacterium]
MQTYLRFVERFALPILVGLLAITLFFVSRLPELTADSNPYLLPENHPARKTILDMRKEFTGTFDAALIGIHNPAGVFNRETLDAVYDMTAAARRIILATDDDRQRLAELGARFGKQSPAWARAVEDVLADGLTQNDYAEAEKLAPLAESLPLSQAERDFIAFLPSRLNPVKELAGMAATENIVARDGVLVVRNAIPDKRTDPEIIRREVMGNRMMVKGVVSGDETVALIAVELYLKQEDAEGQLRAYEAFRSIVADYEKAHPAFTKANQTYIAGVPIFIAEQKKLIDRDMETLFPVVILVVLVILVLFFRRTMGVFLPLANVVLAAIWTLGLMAINRAPLDLITSALPVFLVTICGADAIHMMNEYYTQRAEGHPVKEAVRRAMREMVSPVILTTLTTMAGFLFSTATNISSIQSFGIYMAIGLVFAQLIALLLVPAWINLFGEGRRKGTQGASTPETVHHEWLGNGLVAAFRKVIAHRVGFGSAFALILVLAAYSASQIHVEDAGSSYFAPSNPFRQADDFVNSHVAGTSPGWVSVATGRPGGVLKLETVRFIEALDDFLESQPNVTYTYSLPKYVKRMNLVLNDMDPAYDRLPNEWENIRSTDPETGKAVVDKVSGDELVAQSVLMYENGGGSDLTNVLNSDFSKAISMFTMNTTRASEYQQMLKALDAWLASNTPAGVEVRIGGSPVIWTGVLQEIIQGQLTSFLLALSAVTLVLVLWLRSVSQGILAALPLATTMVCYYGLMTALGIDLNIGTAIISFLVVGIVDYSVHYLHRIQSARAQGMELDAALLHAIRHSGRSIIFNVLVFSLGFLTLLLSEFTTIVHLGALVALALSISGCLSLFLITLLAPAFLRGARVAADEAVSMR